MQWNNALLCSINKEATLVLFICAMVVMFWSFLFVAGLFVVRIAQVL